MPDHDMAGESACRPLEWHTFRSTPRTYQGVYAVAPYLSRDHEGGTIRVDRPFPTSAIAAGWYKLSRSIYLWSVRRCDVNRSDIAGSLGSTDPEREAHFAIIGQSDMAARWKQYTCSQVLTPAQRLWAAFGFGTTWKGSRTPLHGLRRSHHAARGESTASTAGVEPLETSIGRATGADGLDHDTR